MACTTVLLKKFILEFWRLYLTCSILYEKLAGSLPLQIPLPLHFSFIPKCCVTWSPSPNPLPFSPCDLDRWTFSHSPHRNTLLHSLHVRDPYTSFMLTQSSSTITSCDFRPPPNTIALRSQWPRYSHPATNHTIPNEKWAVTLNILLPGADAEFGVLCAWEMGGLLARAKFHVAKRTFWEIGQNFPWSN